MRAKRERGRVRKTREEGGNRWVSNQDKRQRTNGVREVDIYGSRRTERWIMLCQKDPQITFVPDGDVVRNASFQNFQTSGQEQIRNCAFCDLC